MTGTGHDAPGTSEWSRIDPVYRLRGRVGRTSTHPVPRSGWVTRSSFSLTVTTLFRVFSGTPEEVPLPLRCVGSVTSMFYYPGVNSTPRDRSWHTSCRGTVEVTLSVVSILTSVDIPTNKDVIRLLTLLNRNEDSVDLVHKGDISKTGERSFGWKGGTSSSVFKSTCLGPKGSSTEVGGLWGGRRSGRSREERRKVCVTTRKNLLLTTIRDTSVLSEGPGRRVFRVRVCGRGRPSRGRESTGGPRKGRGVT